jgi:hypothetical protein
VFLLVASGAEGQRATTERVLAGRSVGDLMTAPAVCLRGDMRAVDHGEGGEQTGGS